MKLCELLNSYSLVLLKSAGGALRSGVASRQIAYSGDPMREP
jgi:hypothetical protein